MIERAPEKAARVDYDLIVVGGGVYGASLALEASRLDLRVLLLERADFGGATSWNSLRIVHGGLRYLQTADIQRFRESVQERRWFLRSFPDQVVPLPCLMPLYADGFKTPAVLRAALWINDLLSASRNRGVREDRRLPSGRVLGAGETIELFPGVDQRGLRGAALWYDASMPDSQRILIQMLHSACSRQAVVLNYVEARELLVARRDQQVAGVVARDLETGSDYEYRAPVVVNCAGPWSRDLARRWDRDIAALYRPSLAFNLFLDHPPPSPMAVAVTPRQPNGRTYFLVPWKDRILAGTFHAPCTGEAGRPEPPTEAQIQAFLEDVRTASPELRVSADRVLRVHWGMLPVRAEGTVRLTHRPVIHTHAANQGPAGLYSISGVKFTTARRVAQSALGTIYGSRHRARATPASPPDGRSATDPPPNHDIQRMLREDTAAAERAVRRLVRDEAVVHLDDLLLRRTDWGIIPGEGRWSADIVRDCFGWDDARTDVEWLRLDPGRPSASAIPE